jgi:nicotinate-nucleotide adenylyltransferase
VSRPSPARRVGVLGGTFDPVHLGHLASATQVARAERLERVLLVLSARPPHKPTQRPAPIEHRWAMLEIATRGRSDIAACDLEIRRAGPSFTVDTLAEILLAHPGTELFLIVGIDAYREIDTWYRPELLLERANLVVTTRPGHEMHPAEVLPPVAARKDCCYDPAIGCQRHKSGHKLLTHRLDGLHVSSTEIRHRAAAGRDVSDMTGADVARYIRENRLYQGSTS